MKAADLITKFKEMQNPTLISPRVVPFVMLTKLLPSLFPTLNTNLRPDTTLTLTVQDTRTTSRI